MGDRLTRAVTGAAGAADLDTATPFGRVTRPDDVAAVVAFLVSGDATMVTGQGVEVTSGTPMPTRPLEDGGPQSATDRRCRSRKRRGACFGRPDDQRALNRSAPSIRMTSPLR